MDDYDFESDREIPSEDDAYEAEFIPSEDGDEEFPLFV